MGNSDVFTHVHFKNYCSFLDAKVDLSPVTLVIGANGSGKSNFLKAFASLPVFEGPAPYGAECDGRFPSHFNNRKEDAELVFSTRKGTIELKDNYQFLQPPQCKILFESNWLTLRNKLFLPDPDVISQAEVVISRARVAANGSGTAQVLHDLKNGANEIRFGELKNYLSDYIPEIQNLSFRFPENGQVAWQVAERGINDPVKGFNLSAGTRIVIFLLAVLYQDNPPNVILLEDVDHGMHPRLFEKLIDLFRRMAADHGIQIIATTHNPYLINCFQDDPSAVVIVEKKNGNSTLKTLAQAMEGLDYDPDDPESLPLGDLWFSGFAGGVPERFLAAK